MHILNYRGSNNDNYWTNKLEGSAHGRTAWRTRIQINKSGIINLGCFGRTDGTWAPISGCFQGLVSKEIGGVVDEGCRDSWRSVAAF